MSSYADEEVRAHVFGDVLEVGECELGLPGHHTVNEPLELFLALGSINRVDLVDLQTCGKALPLLPLFLEARYEGRTVLCNGT